MNDMQPPLVSQTLTAGVLTLTLGGGKAHALSSAMIAALHDALTAAAQNPEVRVVVLYGPGTIFCAGHDLREMNARRSDPDDGRAFLGDLFNACSAMMQVLATLPKPTIALVEGVATAAGLQMVASCDLAFAADTARFSLPGVNNGGFCTTPAVAVSRAVAPKHVMELLYSGEFFGTDWALAAGLVNRVYPGADVVAQCMAFATTLATRNPGPISAGKSTLQAHLGQPLDAAYALANETMLAHFMDPTRIARDKASRFNKP